MKPGGKKKNDYSVYIHIPFRRTCLRDFWLSYSGCFPDLKEHGRSFVCPDVFVSISIGMHRGILSKIREYHIKIFIIPAGIIAGSIVGGIICSLLLKIPVGQGTAIASGMGWYSLAGAAISELGGAKLGSIAFMSNLMREIFSFFLIPLIALKLNDLTCIAPAGATSEDTTLPVMLKYTNEETVVLSVLNGMLCSFAVPVLISVFAG